MYNIQCNVKQIVQRAREKLYNWKQTKSENQMALSKTQQALAYLQEGMSPKEAAEKAGVAESTLRVAMGKRTGKTICPCCGQVVREGFEINPGLVRKQN